MSFGQGQSYLDYGDIDAGLLQDLCLTSSGVGSEEPYAQGLSAPYAGGSSGAVMTDEELLQSSGLQKPTTMGDQKLSTFSYSPGGRSVYLLTASLKAKETPDSKSSTKLSSYYSSLRVAKCPVCVDRNVCFPAYLTKYEPIVCAVCGQTFNREMFVNDVPASESGLSETEILQTYRATLEKTTGGTSVTKYNYQQFHGVTIYECKLLSPLLSRYRLDFDRPSSLELLSSEIAVASLKSHLSELSTMDFHLEPSLSTTPRYGMDMTGSAYYLRPTLDSILPENGQQDRLVPLHVDGDGWCLAHAVSRCLVGQPIFWHPLLVMLGEHLREHSQDYLLRLGDFMDQATAENEWANIVAETEADTTANVSASGEYELGLRLEHVFGMANLLRRPIILLDGVTDTADTSKKEDDKEEKAEKQAAVQSHTGGFGSNLFLPLLFKPEDCCQTPALNGTGLRKNPPIVVAWSSVHHGHFVPLVAYEDRELPRFARKHLPQVFLSSEKEESDELVHSYVDFDEDDCCTVGSGVKKSRSWLKELVVQLRSLFAKDEGISHELAASYNREIVYTGLYVDLPLLKVAAEVRRVLDYNALLYCPVCASLRPSCDYMYPAYLEKGGIVYEAAVQAAHPNGLRNGQRFSGVSVTNLVMSGVYIYDKKTDRLWEECVWCSSGQLREVFRDGSIAYRDFDIAHGTLDGNKYKMFVSGEVVEAMSGVSYIARLPVVAEYPGDATHPARRAAIQVGWVFGTSNAFNVAKYIMKKHFPEAIGSHCEQELENSLYEELLRASAELEDEYDAYYPQAGYNGSGGFGASQQSKVVELPHADEATELQPQLDAGEKSGIVSVAAAETDEKMHDLPAHSQEERSSAPGNGKSDMPNDDMLAWQQAFETYETEVYGGKEERLDSDENLPPDECKQDEMELESRSIKADDGCLTAKPGSEKESLAEAREKVENQEESRDGTLEFDESQNEAGKDVAVAPVLRVKTCSLRWNAGNNHARLRLQLTVTFSEFQDMVREKTGIPGHQQKLRWSYPPKMITNQDDLSEMLKDPAGVTVTADVDGTDKLATNHAGHGISEPKSDFQSQRSESPPNTSDMDVDSVGMSCTGHVSLDDEAQHKLHDDSVCSSKKEPKLAIDLMPPIVDESSLRTGGYHLETLRQSVQRLEDGMWYQGRLFGERNVIYDAVNDKLLIAPPDLRKYADGELASVALPQDWLPPGGLIFDWVHARHQPLKHMGSYSVPFLPQRLLVYDEQLSCLTDCTFSPTVVAAVSGVQDWIHTTGAHGSSAGTPQASFHNVHSRGTDESVNAAVSYADPTADAGGVTEHCGLTPAEHSEKANSTAADRSAHPQDTASAQQSPQQSPQQPRVRVTIASPERPGRKQAGGVHSADSQKGAGVVTDDDCAAILTYLLLQLSHLGEKLNVETVNKLLSDNDVFREKSAAVLCKAALSAPAQFLQIMQRGLSGYMYGKQHESLNVDQRYLGAAGEPLPPVCLKPGHRVHELLLSERNYQAKYGEPERITVLPNMFGSNRGFAYDEELGSFVEVWADTADMSWYPVADGKRVPSCPAHHAEHRPGCPAGAGGQETHHQPGCPAGVRMQNAEHEPGCPAGIQARHTEQSSVRHSVPSQQPAPFTLASALKAGGGMYEVLVADVPDRTKPCTLARTPPGSPSMVFYFRYNPRNHSFSVLPKVTDQPSTSDAICLPPDVQERVVNDSLTDVDVKQGGHFYNAALLHCHQAGGTDVTFVLRGQIYTAYYFSDEDSFLVLKEEDQPEAPSEFIPVPRVSAVWGTSESDLNWCYPEDNQQQQSLMTTAVQTSTLAGQPSSVKAGQAFRDLPHDNGTAVQQTQQSAGQGFSSNYLDHRPTSSHVNHTTQRSVSADGVTAVDRSSAGVSEARYMAKMQELLRSDDAHYTHQSSAPPCVYQGSSDDPR